ncbi:MAG: type II toxin-antitoxin system VapC family toxin [Planctomycetaceae bacterium]
MPSVFADTFYWVALLSPRDPFHAQVLAWGRNVGPAQLVTTDDVLTEVLNWFGGAGSYWRGHAATLVHQVRSDPQVNVLPQTRVDFDAALALYETRPDKGYSLTDCRSMLALRALGVTDVLTNDHHFTQEGFSILFP